jgi:hypothetical protein
MKLESEKERNARMRFYFDLSVYLYRAVGILAKDLRCFVHHFQFLNTVVEKINKNPEDYQKSLIQYFQSFQLDKKVEMDLKAEVIVRV